MANRQIFLKFVIHNESDSVDKSLPRIEEVDITSHPKEIIDMFLNIDMESLTPTQIRSIYELVSSTSEIETDVFKILINALYEGIDIRKIKQKFGKNRFYVKALLNLLRMGIDVDPFLTDRFEFCQCMEKVAMFEYRKYYGYKKYLDMKDIPEYVLDDIFDSLDYGFEDINISQYLTRKRYGETTITHKKVYDWLSVVIGITFDPDVNPEYLDKFIMLMIRNSRLSLIPYIIKKTKDDVCADIPMFINVFQFYMNHPNYETAILDIIRKYPDEDIILRNIPNIISLMVDPEEIIGLSIKEANDFFHNIFTTFSNN